MITIDNGYMNVTYDIDSILELVEEDFKKNFEGFEVVGMDFDEKTSIQLQANKE